MQNREHEKVGVNTQAVCGSEQPKYVAVRFVAAADTETGEKKAECPPETFAYSGGLNAPPKANVAINANYPVPVATGATAWGGYLDNRGSKDEDNASVIALCGTVQPEIASTVNTPTDPHHQRKLSAICPANTFAFAGGLTNSTGYLGLTVNSLGPKTAAGKPGQRGMVIADTIGGSIVNITGAAVCGLTT